MFRSTLILVAGVCLGGADSAFGCFAIAGDPGSWVRDADSIVRVRAVEGVSVGGGATVTSSSHMSIRFEITEVLKGDPVFALSVAGTLEDRSDFNDRTVPYEMVRPGGRGGDCFARSYQPEGEYLLLLKKREGQLTPYWAPLGATNEQVRGADDPWVVWVRGELSVQRAELPDRPLQPTSGDPGDSRFQARSKPNLGDRSGTGRPGPMQVERGPACVRCSP
jgi:hypothetical protein